MKAGHNSGISGKQLKSFIERIERLNEEKAGLSEDIREVFAEAKANGFDNKTMRKVLAIRKMELSAYEEEKALVDIYLSALGIL